MKNVLTYFLAVMMIAGMIGGSCVRSSSGAGKNLPSDTTGTAILTFRASEHDFGKVKAGEKVGCIFSYTNTGDADLVITSASEAAAAQYPDMTKSRCLPAEPAPWR